MGAYQEILGDLHNLFGDTDAVHVKLDDGDYRVEHVVEGDSVSEVLSYVQYNKEDLISRVRRAVEVALREKRLTMAESGRLMRATRKGWRATRTSPSTTPPTTDGGRSHPCGRLGDVRASDLRLSFSPSWPSAGRRRPRS